MLSHFFSEKILSREATISKEFVESIIAADGTWDLFVDTQDKAGRGKLEEFFTHLANMPDVVRANIYGRDRSVLWSSDRELLGNHFIDNKELDKALKGELVYDSGIIGKIDKEEHRNLGTNSENTLFIETYIPIWDKDRTDVVGVAELYKFPRVLQESIIEGQRLIWSYAVFGGMLLFASLYWIVKRASKTMEIQQQQLIETKSLSMIGETASAIAHAMRNPLASIRVCAELTLTDDLEGARESAEDIIAETDRLDRWARELLQFSAASTETAEYLDINDVITSVLREYETTLESSAISINLSMAQARLIVQAHFSPLSQVFGNLIMNAVEAMGEHGDLSISTAIDSHRNEVTVNFEDNGPGLAKEISDKVFRPFTTTKPTGTGLGLALSRHLLEHFGGSLEIINTPGRGVTAVVCLPLADKTV